MNKRGLRITVNSPVILGFTAISFLALVLGQLTNGSSTYLLFSVHRSSLGNLLTYVRLFGHVFGHANFEHFLGNIMLLLVVGPLLEEKYGQKDMIFVIGSTAVITGILHMIIFPNVVLLGASGVVFAMILLSSFTSIREGEIPLAFILVAVVYLGQQIYQGLFSADNVSQFTHIIGGLIGAAVGYMSSGRK